MIGVPNEDKKRRLPVWITEVAATGQTGQTRKDRTENKTESRLEVGVLPQAKLRLHRKGPIASKDAPSEDLSPPANIETNKRKMKSSQNPRCDNVVTEAVPRKKTRNTRRKVQESGTENCDVGYNDALESSSLSDVEGELTIEDLISIAEEYVEADENTVGQQKQADKKSTGVSLLTANCVAADATQGSHNPPHSQSKYNRERTDSGHSTESLTENYIVCGTISRTGDPAQDMLDVFLGPLLNKPPKEKQIDFTVEESRFNCEIEKRSQCDNVEELLPPTRKKSSLKEKVAMFFE